MPNRGTFVAAPTPADVEEIVLLRGALEGLAAAAGGGRMGRRDLRALDDLVARMEIHTGPGAHEESAFIEADAEFHSALVRLSGHRRLQRMWSETRPVPLAADGESGRIRRVERPAMAREHRALLETLASGDTEAAQQAVWAHITRPLAAQAGSNRR